MSDFLTAAAQSKAEQRGVLLRVLAGIHEAPTAPDTDPPAASGFDGGARPVAPITPSHEETVLAIIATRAGDVGRDL